MLRNWFAGLAATALLLAAPVAPRAQSLRPPKLDISQFTLPNGLNVVALEDHSAPIVNVQVWYHVGSKDERAGRTGFAHLFEHLMFKGSAHVKPQEHAQRVSDVGGVLNAGTNFDYTSYWETVPATALEQMLWLEADRMGSLNVDEANLKSERQVVIEELRLRIENPPYGKLAPLVFSTAFQKHSYHWLPIGSKEDLEAATLDDVRAFHNTYYVPNNATLVVVGDVDADDAVKRVEHHFGGIAPGPAPSRVRTPEPEQTGERRLVIRKEGTTAYLKAGYHAPAAADADFHPLLILDAVLTGAKGLNLWSSFRVAPPQRSARLYRALVERGLASAVSGSLMPTEDPFLYTISATATERTPLAAVEGALLEALDRVVREGITEAELKKAKAQLRARLVFDTDSVTNIAHQLGYFETIGGVDLFVDAPARIAAVSVEEAADAARRVFAQSNRTIGWFDPPPAA